MGSPTSTNKVHDAHIRACLPDFHRSLIDIVGAINRPERDEMLLEMADLRFERALFPLLVLVGKLGPIGVVDLAGRVGRDHTTVSRQVGRLEQLALVSRRAGTADRRTREAAITAKGKAATDAVDRARERMALALFRDWTGDDFDALLRLMRRLADGLDGMGAAAG